MQKIYVLWKMFILIWLWLLKNVFYLIIDRITEKLGIHVRIYKYEWYETEKTLQH